ncbi:hypothetical protein GWK47_028285 [Chionoecetes opilio]|uniref:Uncharacterized protein n=1 Tax=Chionoecetes opilio TaxID=41210 RepID=A0A8J4YLI3_CHIOP|nr:hypothetical protein GWK47_028285 [Chionoecetes opilio]
MAGVAGATMTKGTKWEEEEDVQKYLKEMSLATPPLRVSLDQVTEASNNFLVEFPLNTARLKTHLKNGKNPWDLETQINSAYPLLHHRCLPLLAAFLSFKSKHGTRVERAVYEGMSLLGLVDRLLLNRPVTFLGRNDQYLLRDRTRGKGGFEGIGSEQEALPLCLKEYLSYDEMKLSALLSVSSRSFFVNDGSRRNKGVPGAEGSFQDSGVIAGMVGARMKKAGFMEWQDCVVTAKQNTVQGGYGPARAGRHLQHLWARMWGVTLPVWEATTVNDNFLKVNTTTRLNVVAYKARMQLTAETLLAEAKSRAEAAGLKAYVHVVGLGLGVWRASHQQDALFVDAWGDAIKESDVTHVAHIDFSWIGAEACQGVRDGEVFPATQTVVHFSSRSLHDPVPPGTLLVVSYAWDGNSLPGNEYWIGKLCSTGDGAAACSSGVAELHNAHINPSVRGDNLHVAGPWGVMHVAEYASRVLR